MYMKLFSFLFSKCKNHQMPIHPDMVGVRLDQFMKKNGVGYSLIHKALRTKLYYVVDETNKIQNQPNYRLKANDRFFYPADVDLTGQQQTLQQQDNFYRIPKEEALKQIQKMLIFQNKHLLVLNKCADYSTQGGKDLSKNMFTILISYYKRQNIHIVHRLDKVSSGVIFFAKSTAAARAIQTMINDKINIHKFYLAQCETVINKKQGLINCNIEWNNKKHKGRLCNPSQDESKHAYTYYKSIVENTQTTYLIKLMTGRKHQIRCHLSQYLQNPILNDCLYGAKRINSQYQGIYLHSYCTVIDNKQVIEQLFMDAQVDNSKGKIEFQNDKLVIIANPSWKIPEQQLLKSQIQKLLHYDVKIKKSRFITY